MTFSRFYEKTWILFLAGLFCVPAYAVISDYLSGAVDGIMGRTNNISLFIAAGFVLLSLPAWSSLSSPNERRLRRLSVAIALYIAGGLVFLSPYAVPGIAGMISLLAGLSAGVLAYHFSARGSAAHGPLMIGLALSFPAIPLVPLLVTLDPRALAGFEPLVWGHGNVRWFGYFPASLLCASAALGLYLKRQKGALAPAMLLALLPAAQAWSAVFWGGSRAGMIALAVALPLSWLIIGKDRVFQAVFAALSGAMGAALSLLYYTPTADFGLLNRISKTQGALASGDMTDLTSKRSDFWSWVIERISERPATGHGFFPMLGLDSGPFQYGHTHNIVLEYMLGLGIPAALVILSAGLCLWWRAARSARRIDTAWGAACLAIITLLPIYALFSAALFFPFHLIVFGTAMGLLLAREKPAPARTSKATTPDPETELLFA